MILEAVFNLVSSMLKLVFGWINLPDLPDSIMAVIDELFTLVRGSIGIMSVFIDFNMVKILLPVLLIVINFDNVWKWTMFIIKKIPFLGIK